MIDLTTEEGQRAAFLSELERKKAEIPPGEYTRAVWWKHAQEVIGWIEANSPPHLRRNVPRQPKWNPPVKSVN